MNNPLWQILCYWQRSTQAKSKAGPHSNIWQEQHQIFWNNYILDGMIRFGTRRTQDWEKWNLEIPRAIPSSCITHEIMDPTSQWHIIIADNSEAYHVPGDIYRCEQIKIQGIRWWYSGTISWKLQWSNVRWKDYQQAYNGYLGWTSRERWKRNQGIIQQSIQQSRRQGGRQWLYSQFVRPIHQYGVDIIPKRR